MKTENIKEWWSMNHGATVQQHLIYETLIRTRYHDFTPAVSSLAAVSFQCHEITKMCFTFTRD